MRNSHRYLVAVGLLAASAVPASASLIIDDGEFRDPDWFDVKVVDTTPGAAAVSPSMQVLTGGLPDEYRQTNHSWDITGPGVSIVFAHFTPAATFVPSYMGTITSVDFGLDVRCDSAPHVNAVAFGLVAQQGLNYYLYPAGAAIVGGGWVHVGGTGLMPGNFVNAVGSTGSLDFSSSAGPVIFGYYTANGGSGSNMHLTADARADNFHLAVNSVPEPGALAVSAGGTALVALRRRRVVGR